MNKNTLLLKTLLKSTSQINIYKNCKDKKKRKKIMGGIIGKAILYILIMGFAIATCIGYGLVGMINAAPVMCALIISILGFVFTLFKSNGYLFNFKEYDMLMSLPFEPKKVAASKFLYMYVNALPWHLSISIATMIGYGVFAKPAFYVYPIWLVLTFFIPIIPTVIASFFGFIIARMTAGFKKRNILQTTFIFIFVILCFSLRFIIEGMFRDNKVKETLKMTYDMTSGAAKYYLPAGWFSDSVTETSIVGILLLVGVSTVLFAVVFLIVGRSYRSINSALKSHAASKSYRMGRLKKKSVVNTIAFKEYKRLTGSTTYMVNAGMGVILASLLGIITLFIGLDTLISLVSKGAKVNLFVVEPVIPFIIYFFIGMMSTTACSPSLEGKNYWIIQSSPIRMKTFFMGKMLFNMYMTVPFMTFSILCMCISAHVSVLDTILYIVLGFSLCLLSTTRGCVCGMKHMRLDWENEIEVVKQGAGVTIYLLPNMFACMAVGALSIILGLKMNHSILTSIFIAVTLILAIFYYYRVIRLSAKMERA